MFKKPFRIKSQTSMKGSDRKKLRAEIQKNYPNLDECFATEIIPNKEEVTVVKIYLHTGENAFIYSVNKIPVLFEIDKQKILYPSVYLLWRYPDLIQRFTTWPPVFKKLTDGADLMLPGIILRENLTPTTFKHVQKGLTCSISIFGNRAPVAVGFTLLSGSDFYDAGMKGKGVHPVHWIGDELWSFGDKSIAPELQDDPLPEEMVVGEIDTRDGENGAIRQDTKQNNIIIDQLTVKDVGNTCQPDNIDINGEIVVNTQDLTENPEFSDLDPQDLTKEPELNDHDIQEQVDSMDDVIESCSGISQLAVSEPSDIVSPEDMDKLLHFCFLCALKSSVKKTDLPLPTGTLYKHHMLIFCPSGKNVDVKKSTYKKLSRYLQQQESCGIIKLETTKGVDRIVDVDNKHELLRGFEAPEPMPRESKAAAESEFIPPQITEMFAVNSVVLPLFKEMGYSKGYALKSHDVRKIVTDYVKTKTEQPNDIKSEVLLDPILAEILLTNAEGDRSFLTWDAVFSRMMNKMAAVYEIAVFGQDPIIRKGNLEPIKLDVLSRAANKKVTIVENLDLFGIDPKSFGQIVQVKVACSASVSPSPQKNKGPQVVIQGNQVSFVGNLLTECL